uniref:Uncharacterized protein n=1 Tax=Anopheles coluzzii TaxID=1518534 RepID=A0A8W7P3B7_ANOCL
MLRKLLRRIFCPCSRKPSKESEEHETPEEAIVQELVVGTPTVDGKKRPVSSCYEEEQISPTCVRTGRCRRNANGTSADTPIKQECDQ